MAMNYLTQYGITKQTGLDFEEIDITDKFQLEAQINTARRNYNKLLKTYDMIDENMIENQRKMKLKGKEVIERAGREGKRPNDLFSIDDDYIELEIEREALKTGKDMISAQMSFVNNDLRILNSALYNKF